MQLNSLGGRRASFGTPGAVHPTPRTNNYKPLQAGKSVLLDICEISPFEKWTRYRVVPVKFLLHVALVILTTACIVEDSVRWVPYRFANQQNFCYFFAPDKCVDNLCGSSSLSYGIDNPSNCYTYAINETIDAVQKIVGNYFDLHHRSVANYYLPQLPDGSLKKILMTIERQPHSSSDRTARRTATYWITPDDLGPLDTRKETAASISEFFELLLSMRLDLELDDTFASDRHELCYMWSVQVIFNVRNKAELSVNQKARVLGFCTDRMTGREIAVDPLRFWLNVLVILFGGLLGLLILKEWFDSYRLLAYARVAVMDLDAMPSVRDTGGPAPASAVLLRRDSSLPDQQLFWDEVTTGIKARFFNFWLLETLLASILSTTEAAYNLMYYKGPMTSSTHTLMAGLGSALFWINLVNYLHHSDRLYAIVLVIRRSIPRVGKLLVQVIPIFVGYALFGVMVFGYYYPSFGTFAYASASLFSIWNGDMLLSTIQDLNIFFLYFGFFYVLLFVFAFIYVILNIVLCIVQQTLVHVYTVEAKRRHTIHRVLRKGRRSSISQRRRVSTRDSIIDDDKYGTSKRDGTGVGLEPWSSSSRLFIEVLDLVKEHDPEGDIFCASFTAPSAAQGSPRAEGGNGTAEGPSASHRRRHPE